MKLDRFGRETIFDDNIEDAFHEFCEYYNYHGRLYSYEERMIKEALDYQINGDKYVQDIEKAKAK